MGVLPTSPGPVRQPALIPPALILVGGLVGLFFAPAIPRAGVPSPKRPDREIPSGETENPDPANADPPAPTRGSAPKPPPDPDGMTNEAKEPSAAVAAMGASAPTGRLTGKPWQVFATLNQSLSSGVFSASAAARQVSYGYSISVAGLYRLVPLGEGSIEAFGRMSLDQELTPNFHSTGTREREIFFRDISIGALARGLYTEPTTGIIFGASTSFQLPTSKASQALDRIFRWNLSAHITKIFKEVGAGMLVLAVRETFRKDVGPAVGTIDDERFDCRQRIVVAGGPNSGVGGDQGTCLSALNANWGLIHAVNTAYIWGNFTFGIAFQLFSIWDINAQDSATDGLGFEVGRSPYANDTAFNASTFASVSVNYALNRHVNFTLGTATTQEQYGKNQDGEGWHVRFPFWDTETTGHGNSSIFFAVNALY